MTKSFQSQSHGQNHGQIQEPKQTVYVHVSAYERICTDTGAKKLFINAKKTFSPKTLYMKIWDLPKKTLAHILYSVLDRPKAATVEEALDAYLLDCVRYGATSGTVDVCPSILVKHPESAVVSSSSSSKKKQDVQYEYVVISHVHYYDRSISPERAIGQKSSRPYSIEVASDKKHKNENPIAAGTSDRTFFYNINTGEEETYVRVDDSYDEMDEIDEIDNEMNTESETDRETSEEECLSDPEYESISPRKMYPDDKPVKGEHNCCYYRERCEDTLMGWTYTKHPGSICLTPPEAWQFAPETLNVSWYKRPLYYSEVHDGYFMTDSKKYVDKVIELGAAFDAESKKPRVWYA